MGWISKRYMRTNLHLAHNGKTGKRSGVLRKITGMCMECRRKQQEQ